MVHQLIDSFGLLERVIPISCDKCDEVQTNQTVLSSLGNSSILKYSSNFIYRICLTVSILLIT